MSLKTLCLCGALLLGCGPPCTPLAPAPLQEVCHRADAGAIVADAPFVLMGSTSLYNGTCQVNVDGGQIDLSISGTAYCGGSSGFAKPASPQPLPCAIPALPAGSYSVNSVSPQTLTLPQPDGGAGSIPPCP